MKSLKILCFLVFFNQIAYSRPKPLPLSVEISTAHYSDIEDGSSYLGTIKAINSSELALETSGVVRDIFVKDNSFVKQGEIILQINSNLIKADLIAANAGLSIAKSNAARGDRLIKNKVLSQADHERFVNELKIAKSKVALLEEKLAQTKLIAPFSGNVSTINISPGEYLKAGDKITTLSDLSNFKVEFYVPQEKINQINSHATITVIVNNLKYQAILISKEVVADSNTRNVKVVARVLAKKLYPGSYANVKVINMKNVILVPETAVGFSTEGTYIYKFIDNKPIKQNVEIGRNFKGSFEVKKGIQVGEQYVSVGQFKLYPNAQIKVIKGKS